MKSLVIISRLEMFFILTFATISLAPIGISSLLIRSFKQSSWMVIMVAYLVGIINLFITLRLAGRYPDQTIGEWASHYLGKWGARVYGVLAVCVLFFWSIFMFLKHWHLTTYAQLHQTPQFLPAILELGAITYLLTRGLEAWARVLTALAPWAFIGLIAINLPQFANSDFARLLPVFKFETSSGSWQEWVLALFMFRTNMLIYYLYPQIKAADKLFRSSLLAISIACLEILLSVLLPLSIFGPNVAGNLTFPYQESLETIHLTGLPLSKLSFISPLLWLVIMVYVLASSLYCAMKGIQGLLPKAKENQVTIILGVLATIVLLFHIAEIELNKLVFYWSVLGMLIFMAIPLIFWMIPHKKG